jgi:MFS family permease
MELPVQDQFGSVVPADAPPPPTKKLPFPALLGTSVYQLGVNAIWTSFYYAILPALVERSTNASGKTLYFGIITTVGTGIGITVNIIAGIVSDHFTTKRFGRRAPVMLIGAVLTAPFLLLGIFLPVTIPLLFAIFIGMEIFTNVSAAAFQPTLADFIPENQRGISAGFKGLFTIIGSAVGVVLVSSLLGAGQDIAAYIVLASLFVGTTLLNIAAMRPYDKTNQVITPLHLGAAVRDMFRLRAVKGGFYWFVAGSFLVYMALSSLQGYALYYIEAALHQSQDQALTSQAIFGGISLIVTVTFSIIAGIISDRIGRRNLIIGAVILGAIISLLFPFIPVLGDTFPALGVFGIFLIIGSLYSAAIGMFQTVDTAMSSDLVPSDEAGKYMSFANLGVGLANTIAPLFFGFILFIQGVTTVQSYTAIFIVTAIFFTLSAFIMALRVQNR